MTEMSVTLARGWLRDDIRLADLTFARIEAQRRERPLRGRAEPQLNKSGRFAGPSLDD